MQIDWVDFFKDDGGRMSMTRLMMFLSFFPASWVVIKDLGEGTLSWYLGAYVLGYVGGKASDAIQNRKAPVNVENVEKVEVADGR